MSDVAAKRLVGQELEGGWKVISSVEKTGSQTGSYFSQGYLVENGRGERAFLKAMDFSEALKAADFTRAVESLARQFNFERDLLEFCKTKRMRNVVRSIGGGMVDVGSGGPMDRVQYFIFEPADGDIRRVIDSFSCVTVAWALRVLHEVSVGLRQLHLAMIAHQDLKPSNILSFGESSIKLGDLGSASMRSNQCPRDSLMIPGQISYAPPEQLYGEFHPDWVARRVGSDMYQLGGVCVFLVTGVSINSLVADRLRPEQHWDKWAGSYRDVLPHVQYAFSQVLDEISPLMENGKVPGLLEIVKELCEPDIDARGDQRRIKRGAAQYSIEPFVSKFGALRRAAEAALARSLR